MKTWDRPFRADAQSLRLSGHIDSGLCWDTMTRKRMNDPKALEPYGFKVYSQNDEDGIIQEIFRRIGTTNRRFVEFGVQDGLECNGHYLLFKGWKGLWIEGDPEYVKTIKERFRPVLNNGQLQVINAFITRENINSLISSAGFLRGIDLLSIDIDGNDYYVWEAIDVVEPRVVCIEYNGKLPPDLEWIMAYDPEHHWRWCDWQGASLKALENLGRRKNYRLVGTGLNGVNCFFVRNDLCGNKFISSPVAEAVYNPIRAHLGFVATHPAKYCLVGQQPGYGLLNYKDYDLCVGFHDEETVPDCVHAWTSQTHSVMKTFYGPEKGTLVLPYGVPEEVLQMQEDYNVTISAQDYITHEELFAENIDLKQRGGVGAFEIQLPERRERNILLITIDAPFLWRPSTVLHSGDTRELGIDIKVSDMRFLPAEDNKNV